MVSDCCVVCSAQRAESLQLYAGNRQSTSTRVEPHGYHHNTLGGLHVLVTRLVVRRNSKPIFIITSSQTLSKTKPIFGRAAFCITPSLTICYARRASCVELWNRNGRAASQRTHLIAQRSHDRIVWRALSSSSSTPCATAWVISSRHLENHSSIRIGVSCDDCLKP